MVDWLRLWYKDCNLQNYTRLVDTQLSKYLHNARFSKKQVSRKIMETYHFSFKLHNHVKLSRQVE